MSILTENWHACYIGGADSESRLRLLKFRPQNPFLGKFGPKKSKLSVFFRKLVHMVSQRCWFVFQHLLSEFQILISYLGKFEPKKPNLSVLTENWHTWYLGSADSESVLGFLKFWPQNLFLGKFEPKKSKLSSLAENWHTVSR